MKIVYFNLNYGRNDFKGVLDFIKINQDTDVFCFQEIKDEIKESIDKVLENYVNSFVSKELGDFGSFNLAIYLNKNYENYNFEVLEDNFEKTAPSVFLEVYSGNSKWNILNFHGQPSPGTKIDTIERLEASKRILKFMKNKEGFKIIGGDFNLLPETKSIQALEKFGYVNLIKEFKTPTTRNNNAWKLYPENKQLFADYIFISRDISVKKFEVITNEISDHLPMILEIF